MYYSSADKIHENLTLTLDSRRLGKNFSFFLFSTLFDGCFLFEVLQKKILKKFTDISCMGFKNIFGGQEYQLSNLNKEKENFNLGTVNNIIVLIQSMLMNEGLFSLPSQKEELLNFGGFTTAVVMLEAIVLDKIHTGPADHERGWDHTNNEEFCVLGETEDCMQ